MFADETTSSDLFGAAPSLDDLALGLRQLRVRAGAISYGEIAVRIAERRQAAGVQPAAARVARSSVHAMFNTGRRRMNADLVFEVVLALGESEMTAAQWRDRCIRAQHPDSAADFEQQTVLPPPVSTSAIPVSLRMAPARATSLFPKPIMALVIVACIGINYFGNTLNAKFELPLFLDMIGTATAAIALGPWYGALVGLTSNTLAAIGANPISLAFSLVNVAGALVWGYGVRAWRMRRPLWRFALLNILVALVCTFVAVPINVLFFGGVASGHVSVDLVGALIASGEGIWQAMFSVNLSISVTDKLLAGFLAIGIVQLLDGWRSSPS